MRFSSLDLRNDSSHSANTDSIVRNQDAHINGHQIRMPKSVASNQDAHINGIEIPRVAMRLFPALILTFYGVTTELRRGSMFLLAYQSDSINLKVTGIIEFTDLI